LSSEENEKAMKKSILTSYKDAKKDRKGRKSKVNFEDSGHNSSPENFKKSKKSAI